MNRFKYGVCLWALPFENPFDACACVKKIGFDGIQIEYPMEMCGNKDTDKIYADIKAAAQKYDLEIMTIVVTALDHISIVAPDGNETAEKAVDCLDESLRIARNLNIPTVMIPKFANSDLRGSDGNGDHEKIAIAAKRLQQLCDNAKDTNIKIATESLLMGESLSELIRLIDRANLKYYFDSQNHYLHMGVKMDDFYRDNSNIVHEIHVKDGVEKELSASLLGEGTTGYFDTAKAVCESNFSGWIVSENYYHLEPLSKKASIEVLLSADLKTMKETFLN